MRRTLKDRQEFCEIILEAIEDDETLLEHIIDDYVYRLNDNELDELEDLLVNQFGED